MDSREGGACQIITKDHPTNSNSRMWRLIIDCQRCFRENLHRSEDIECPEEGLPLEDCFRLENNHVIEAWVLNWNYAVDKEGDIYGCYFEK